MTLSRFKQNNKKKKKINQTKSKISFTHSLLTPSTKTFQLFFYKKQKTKKKNSHLPARVYMLASACIATISSSFHKMNSFVQTDSTRKSLSDAHDDDDDDDEPIETIVRRRFTRSQDTTNKAVSKKAYLSTYPALGVSVSLVHTNEKGWTVIANEFIPKSTTKAPTFVMEYAGDLMTGTEGERLETVYAMDHPNAGSYMLWFSYYNKWYCMDGTNLPPTDIVEEEEANASAAAASSSHPLPSGYAMRFGYSRFLSHSSTPNLFIRTNGGNSTDLRAPTLDGVCPRLCFFAKEDIPKGAELTFDYGDRSKQSIADFSWLGKSTPHTKHTKHTKSRK